jgi:hypothetical protein
MLGLGLFLLASTLPLAPLGANSADFVVWWEEGLYPREDAAVAEVHVASGISGCLFSGADEGADLCWIKIARTRIET